MMINWFGRIRLMALLCVLGIASIPAFSAVNATVQKGSMAAYSFIKTKKAGGFNLPAGTTAQRPVCTSSLNGVERFNTTTSVQEVCNGTAWVTGMILASDGTPPSPPQGNGYFVLSAGSWNGNLGGMVGAADKCYSDLTANDWMGKSDASSRGLLVPSRIRAFICEGNACDTPFPLATYYFAKSGDPTVGGASLSTDANADGPFNDYNWTGRNYFSESVRYWTYRKSYTRTDISWGYAGNDAAHYYESSCSSFTSSNPADTSIVGSSVRSDVGRWSNGDQACDKLARLICMVHP